MELLGDVVMRNLTYFSLEIVLMSVQDRCTICDKVPSAQKSIWTHPLGLLGDEAQVKARFSPFGDSANLAAR